MRYLLWLLLKLRLYPLLSPVRTKLAKRYLSGAGIEIGALHLPLWVPPEVSVKYVDHAPVESLRTIYPELNIFQLVPVDIIDNGETLEAVPPVSQDFIIANHFIEHCENPLRALMSHLSRLKPGGILYLAIPNRDRTFDRHRPVTTLDHLIRDFQNGPDRSRLDHYREWAQEVEQVPAEKVEDRVQDLIRARYSIHFHVWRQTDFQDLLEYLKTGLKQAFTIRETVSSKNEFIFILQKLGEPPCTT